MPVRWAVSPAALVRLLLLFGGVIDAAPVRAITSRPSSVLESGSPTATPSTATDVSPPMPSSPFLNPAICPDFDGKLVKPDLPNGKHAESFRLACGIDHFGGDLFDKPTAVYEGGLNLCLLHCANNANCVAVAFSEGPVSSGIGDCYLKRFAAPETDVVNPHIIGAVLMPGRKADAYFENGRIFRIPVQSLESLELVPVVASASESIYSTSSDVPGTSTSISTTTILPSSPSTSTLAAVTTAIPSSPGTSSTLPVNVSSAITQNSPVQKINTTHSASASDSYSMVVTSSSIYGTANDTAPGTGTPEPAAKTLSSAVGTGVVSPVDSLSVQMESGMMSVTAISMIGNYSSSVRIVTASSTRTSSSSSLESALSSLSVPSLILGNTSSQPIVASTASASSSSLLPTTTTPSSSATISMITIHATHRYTQSSPGNATAATPSNTTESGITNASSQPSIELSSPRLANLTITRPALPLPSAPFANLTITRPALPLPSAPFANSTFNRLAKTRFNAPYGNYTTIESSLGPVLTFSRQPFANTTSNALTSSPLSSHALSFFRPSSATSAASTLKSKSRSGSALPLAPTLSPFTLSSTSSPAPSFSSSLVSTSVSTGGRSIIQTLKLTRHFFGSVVTRTATMTKATTAAFKNTANEPILSTDLDNWTSTAARPASTLLPITCRFASEEDAVNRVLRNVYTDGQLDPQVNRNPCGLNNAADWRSIREIIPRDTLAWFDLNDINATKYFHTDGDYVAYVKLFPYAPIVPIMAGSGHWVKKDVECDECKPEVMQMYGLDECDLQKYWKYNADGRKGKCWLNWKEVTEKPKPTTMTVFVSQLPESTQRETPHTSSLISTSPAPATLTTSIAYSSTIAVSTLPTGITSSHATSSTIPSFVTKTVVSSPTSLSMASSRSLPTTATSSALPSTTISISSPTTASSHVRQIPATPHSRHSSVSKAASTKPLWHRPHMTYWDLPSITDTLDVRSSSTSSNIRFSHVTPNVSSSMSKPHTSTARIPSQAHKALNNYPPVTITEGRFAVQTISMPKGTITIPETKETVTETKNHYGTVIETVSIPKGTTIVAGAKETVTTTVTGATETIIQTLHGTDTVTLLLPGATGVTTEVSWGPLVSTKTLFSPMFMTVTAQVPGPSSVTADKKPEAASSEVSSPALTIGDSIFSSGTADWKPETASSAVSLPTSISVEPAPPSVTANQKHEATSSAVFSPTLTIVESALSALTADQKHEAASSAVASPTFTVVDSAPFSITNAQPHQDYSTPTPSLNACEDGTESCSFPVTSNTPISPTASRTDGKHAPGWPTVRTIYSGASAPTPSSTSLETLRPTSSSSSYAPGRSSISITSSAPLMDEEGKYHWPVSAGVNVKSSTWTTLSLAIAAGLWSIF